jgi:hypothetical protein
MRCGHLLADFSRPLIRLDRLLRSQRVHAKRCLMPIQSCRHVCARMVNDAWRLVTAERAGQKEKAPAGRTHRGKGEQAI